MKGSSTLSRRNPSRLDEPYRKKNSSSTKVKKTISEGDVSLKVLLDNRQAGTLIGSEGLLIKELIEVSGANIHISGISDVHPGTLDRVVYITGTEDSVSSALSLIWEMIAMIAAVDGDRSEDAEWSPSNAAKSPGAYDDVDVEGKITIPVESAGLIIGRGGQTIRAISEESGAKLSLSSSNSDDVYKTSERVVTVGGRAGSCMNCTALILTKLWEGPEPAVQYATRGTKYPSSSATLVSVGTVSGSTVNSAAVAAIASGGNPFRKSATMTDRFPSVILHNGAPSSHPSQRGERQPSTSRGSGSGRRDSTASSSGAGSALTYATGASLISATTTFEIAVPDAHVGNIFGKQGSVLKEIISLSGAHVTISQRGEFVEGTDNRIVTIVGTPASAQTAHTLIAHKLEAAME